MHTDPRFCFAGWHEIEQHEPGDTLIHSFNYFPDVIPWDVWFYLRGEIGGSESPSTSPIMHLPVNYAYPIKQKTQPGWALVGNSLSYNRPLAMNVGITASFEISGIDMWCAWLNVQAQITLSWWSTLFLTKSPITRLYQVTIPHLPNKLQIGNQAYFHFPFPIGFQAELRTYAIVIEGDPSIPDTFVFWWSRKDWPGFDPNEYAWNGVRTNGNINWSVDNVWVYNYGIWMHTPPYQPGPPLPVQMYI